MALLLLLVFGIVLMWLKMYTNHSQQLELRDYVGKPYVKAAKHAEKESFELIVKDSIHKVGQPGGIILAQNPVGGSMVKENRKIYVDVTKYVADVIDLKDLSQMYGRNYDGKKKELGYLDIETKIRGYKQDPGEVNHILEVWYEGRLIAGESGKKSNIKIKKGSTLEFVLSKIDGGNVAIPDLVCKTYSEISFLLPYSKLRIGSVEIEEGSAITDRDNAYVIKQVPAFAEDRTIAMGSSIEITIQQEEPESCK